MTMSTNRILSQPNKNTPIPAGATHWQPSYCQPFIQIQHTPCDAYTASVLQKEAQNIYLPHSVTNIDRTCCYRLVDGQWMIERRKIFIDSEQGWVEEPYRQVNPHDFARKFREDRAIQLQDYAIPADAKRINTVLGAGVVVGHEHGQTLVELDVNPYSFRPCAIYPSDVIH